MEAQTDDLAGTVYNVDYRVTLATITATLLETERDREPMQPNVLASFRAAAGSFWSLLIRLGSVAAWLIVFAPVWGTTVLVAYALRRRARREAE